MYSYFITYLLRTRTIPQIADDLDCPPRKIYRWIAGTSNPTISAVRQIRTVYRAEWNIVRNLILGAPPNA